MTEDLKNYLRTVMNSCDGLLGIIITDRDGVPLIKETSKEAPDIVMRLNSSSPFGIMTEQASKLGMGKNKSIICMNSSYQVIHFNMLPFFVTLLGKPTASTGLMLSLEDSLIPVLNQLQTVVET